MDMDFAEHLMELRKEAEEKAVEAEENGEEPEWQRPSGKSPEGFTPELAAIYSLDERIQSVARILIAVNSKTKPPDIQKTPRPFTALDILALEDERDDMHKLAETFGLRKRSG